MRLLSDDVSDECTIDETFVDHFYYAQFALQARSETRSQEAPLLPLLAELEQKQTGITARSRDVLRAQALLAFENVELDRLIMRLGTAARFDEASSPAQKILALLFKNKRPSDILRPTGAGLGRELEDAELIRQAFALLPESATTVKPLLGELETRLASGRQAYEALLLALDAEKLEWRTVPDLKERAWQALDQIEGQLKVSFPGQRDLVASFFLPAAVARAKKEEESTESADEATSKEG